MAQQELARFEKMVTVKVLPNGLTVLLIRRPEAPVFSYYTLVDAGDANDPTGQSGLAHMFEHLAFKGTDEIGTTNWPAEKVALQKVEETYAAYDREYRKRVGQDPAKLKQLREAFDAAYATELGTRVAADSMAHVRGRRRLFVTEHPIVGDAPLQ